MKANVVEELGQSWVLFYRPVMQEIHWWEERKKSRGNVGEKRVRRYERVRRTDESEEATSCC